MPLWKCKNCQHEWEGRANNPCDWCGGKQMRMLQKETPFENWINDFIAKQETTQSTGAK